jgi:hypothetical protein
MMDATILTAQEAYDEAMRELQVRERCYTKWVKDGKISRTEARQRFNAQATICKILADLPDVVTSSGDTTTDDVPW